MARVENQSWIIVRTNPPNVKVHQKAFDAPPSINLSKYVERFCSPALDDVELMFMQIWRQGDALWVLTGRIRIELNNTDLKDGKREAALCYTTEKNL